MALTDYVTLGRSGLRVSPFCLGAMTFGEDWGWGSSVAESEAIIARFLERGGNFIDTANVYTKGHSEKIIGDLIGRDRAGATASSSRRSSSATCIPAIPTAAAPAARRSSRRASSRCAACRPTTSISTGCTAGISSRPSRRRCARSTISCAAGKVRYIGFSDTPAWKVAQAQTIAQFRGWAPLVALQIEYSLLERTVEGELMPMALELGLGVTPWSPLQERRAVGQVHARERRDRQGRSRRARDAEPRRANVYAIIDELIAHRQGAAARRPAAVALAWVQGRPGVASTIIGARRLDQLEQNLAALDVTLTRGSDRARSTSSRSRRSAFRCSS